MRQMRHKGFRKTWLFSKPFAQSASRDAQNSCHLLCNSVAVVGFREQRSLRNNPAGPRALQYDGATVLTESNKMRFALEHEVEASDGLSKVKKMLTRIELLPGTT